MDKKIFSRILDRLNKIICVTIFVMVAAYFTEWTIQELRADEINNDQFYMKDDDVKIWVSSSAQKALSFKFDSYKKELQEGSRFFARSGWEDFTRYIETNKFISTIEKSQCAILAGSRKIEIFKQGNNPQAGGRYEWQLHMDLAIEFPGCNRDSELEKIYIVVARMPVLEGLGIGIVRWKETE